MEILQFQGLEEKLQKLVQRYELLEKENRKLKAESEKNQILLAQANAKIAKLQQQNDALKIGAEYLSDGDKKMLEYRIDGYLREIDKCLALLDA